MAITLSCLLWAHPGMENALATYEDTVLELVSELDGYLGDPRRSALSAQRDAAIARTDLIRVTRIV